MSTRVQWFAVRCCCQPQKVFGFIRLPSESIERGKVVVALRTVWEASDLLKEMGPRYALSSAELQIKSIGGLHSAEWAVYSDDRPIEFWRNVRGFVEADTETGDLR